MFTQLHNGASQTLALLSRELQQHDISLAEITARLETLNQQIRSIADKVKVRSFKVKLSRKNWVVHLGGKI